MTADVDTVRLTQFAHGGGCACKIPPGELEDMVRGLTGIADADLLVGLDDGDDAAAVRIADGLAVLATADFFTPVVDDAYDWGRIAAANALSDIYAMGGRPVLAVNLLGWPRDVLPPELAAEVLRGGLDVARLAGCPVAGGHSIDDPEPKYGMAVTGVADPNRLLRNDAAVAGLPLSLTKPLGVGVLNNRHKSTGEVFPEAVASMVALNDVASRDALAHGVEAATDVTGFGLLGHLYKMARASGVTAVVDAAAVPYLDGARASLADGLRPRRQPAQPRLGAAPPRRHRRPRRAAPAGRRPDERRPARRRRDPGRHRHRRARAPRRARHAGAMSRLDDLLEQARVGCSGSRRSRPGTLGAGALLVDTRTERSAPDRATCRARSSSTARCSSGGSTRGARPGSRRPRPDLRVIVICRQGYSSSWRPTRCGGRAAGPPTSSAGSRRGWRRAAPVEGPADVRE